jgi:arginase
MAVHLVGMPIFYGSDRFGANFGPEKFREMDVLSALKELGYDVKDLGDIEVADVSEQDKYQYHEKLKYYDAIIDANTKLAFKVYESISKGHFPVTLGGDHSLGMGSIAGVSKHIKNLGVVWIDAHGDINTEETTFTGNVHGMPLAASMGYGPDKLVNLFEHRVKVKDENVVLIAARDLDSGELELIKNSNMKVFTMDMVKDLGMDRVIEQSIEYLKERVDAIHVSFDIDSVDSIYVPGTGTPVGDGITVGEARQLLQAFAASGMMSSLDFVELNPVLDENDVTANICMELLASFFESLNISVNEELMLG